MLDEGHVCHKSAEERGQYAAYRVADYSGHRATHMVSISCYAVIRKDNIIGDSGRDIVQTYVSVKSLHSNPFTISISTIWRSTRKGKWIACGEY